MAVDGLGNIYGTPVVKKEPETGQADIKDRRKDRKREEKKGPEDKREKEGRVDIRV